MRITFIADTHNLHHDLNLSAGDLLVHAGDVCNFGKTAHFVDFIDWFKRQDYRHKIFIAGNHDHPLLEDRERMLGIIPDSITYLQDSGTTVEGIHIWGSPVQPDLVGWPFGRSRGPEIEQHWNLIPENTDLLITHTPPYGILDKSSSGRSLGCEELLKKVWLVKPKIHVFGHIHQSYGQLEREGVHFINAANLNSRRGLVNEPIHVDWN